MDLDRLDRPLPLTATSELSQTLPLLALITANGQRLMSTQGARGWATLRSRRWFSSLRLAGFGFLIFINATCTAHLCAEHIGWIHRVEGPSMVPTMYPEGEWIIESRLTSPHQLRRGDLATYISPLDPSRMVCKRVLGLPGDVVCVDPTGQKAPSTEHVVVPKGHLWMSGDNAELSRDSRDYGPVSMALVKGRQVARIWPPSRFTVFRSNFRYIDDA